MQQVALLTYERPLVGEPIQNSAVRSSATPVQQPSHGCTACVPLPAAAQKLQLLTAEESAAAKAATNCYTPEPIDRLAGRLYEETNTVDRVSELAAA
eukprot:COSAG01_NODE_212_length_21797_cov_14.197806_6_plen_97_part_00